MHGTCQELGLYCLKMTIRLIFQDFPRFRPLYPGKKHQSHIPGDLHLKVVSHYTRRVGLGTKWIIYRQDHSRSTATIYTTTNTSTSTTNTATSTTTATTAIKLLLEPWEIQRIPVNTAIIAVAVQYYPVIYREKRILYPVLHFWTGRVEIFSSDHICSMQEHYCYTSFAK